MGLARSTSTILNNQKNQLRVELTGKAEVITFNFNRNTAESLVYSKETFDKI